MSEIVVHNQEPEVVEVVTVQDILVQRRAQLRRLEDNILPGADVYNHIIATIPHTDISLDSSNLCISLAGTRAQLAEAMRVFRRNGFKPRNRPQAGETSYYAYFHPVEPGPDGSYIGSIWFSYTSTQCVRVQVGTKMVEQPVYEVRCEETLEQL